MPLVLPVNARRMRNIMQYSHSLPFYRSRWMAMLAAIVVFVGLLLVVLPLGMTYGLQKWLLDHGGEDVHIGNVDVNLFSGRAAIQNLSLSAQGQSLLTIPNLVVKIDWLPMFSRQVVLHSIAVDGVGLSIRQTRDGRLLVGGINLPEGGESTEVPAGQQWQLGVDRLSIVATSIEYRTPDLTVTTRLDELDLSGIKTWAADPAPLVIKGTINGAGLHLDGQLPPLAQGFGFRGSVVLDALDLGQFSRIAAAAVSGLTGRLTIDTQLDVLQAPERPLHVTQSGLVRIDGLQFAQAEHRVAIGSLQWDGDLDLTDVSTPTVKASGRVQSSALAYDVSGSDYRLVRIAQLQAGKVSLQGGTDVSVSDLAIKDLELAQSAREDAGPVLSAGALTLDSLQRSGEDTLVGKLEGSGVVARLRRDPDGKWQAVRISESLPFVNSAAAGAAEPVTEAPADRAAATRFLLQQLHITGDSAIELHDDSLKPAFSTRLTLADALIGTFDSAQPGQDSPVSIEGRTGKHSKISVKGTFRPFAERPTLKLDNHMEGIALTELSPYTVAMLGYALKSGDLDADSSLSIDNGMMDGKNRLTLRALEVAPVDNAARKQLDSQLSLPLGTALDMLRDKHDTIKLDLPVTGDIDNPDFDISDAVNTAVSKALKKASMTYLTVALQPYGALISIARLAGEVASRVQLAPVAFAPGAAMQQPGSNDYLDKVAGILASRPELNIKVCGVANESDRATLAAQATAVLADRPADKQGEKMPVEPVRIGDEQLLDLAIRRAEAVTDYLVTRHAVSASRLVDCQPSIDSTPAGKGRVDLLI